MKKTALVTGGKGGLGKHIVRHLESNGYKVHTLDTPNDVRYPEALPDIPALDVLVCAHGINKINWIDNVSPDEFREVMDVNCYGIFRMVQHFKAALAARNGTVCTIVSNAAHMPMRCSAAYNASKGAALILTKQLARELITDGITVFSVSPNKLRDTGMSEDIDKQVMETRGWTREEAQQYQLQGLQTGKETDPAACGEFIAFLLSEKYRNEALSGCDLPYGL